MKKTVTEIPFEEEFRICPVCGYQDGFHSMLKQKKRPYPVAVHLPLMPRSL